MLVSAYTRLSTLSNPAAGYSGDKLRFLHLQAQQLILRRQVECLIAIWGLPNEFEVRWVVNTTQTTQTTHIL